MLVNNKQHPKEHSMNHAKEHVYFPWTSLGEVVCHTLSEVVNVENDVSEMPYTLSRFRRQIHIHASQQ